jgi:hypothetical protein
MKDLIGIAAAIGPGNQWLRLLMDYVRVDSDDSED